MPRGKLVFDLKAIIDQSGLSIADVARLADVPYDTLYYMLREDKTGREQLNMEVAGSVLIALGIHVRSPFMLVKYPTERENLHDRSNARGNSGVKRKRD